LTRLTKQDISIDVALCPRVGKDVETWLKHTDVAVYQSKASERNGFLFFAAEMEGKARGTLRLVRLEGQEEESAGR